MSEQIVFSFQGSVQASGGYYIWRKADDKLFTLCRDGMFAYVLAPRQVGKSSLMNCTAGRLADENIVSVIVDLNQIGKQVTADEWYLGQLVIIQDKLELKTNVIEWWHKQARLGLAQRLFNFYRKILLAEIKGPVVVFIDEIETTRNLGFTDDFYAAIRSIHNARPQVAAFKRLSFVMIGSAAPNDLIHDPQRTPFNIAERVEITDFTFDEALPLAEGLCLTAGEAQQVLAWILKWTGGHPYLTQRLCRAVVEENRTRWSESDVNGVVADTFLGEMKEKDNNLLVVRDMLTKGAPDRVGVLTTYRDIHRGRPVVYDEEQSIIKSHLKLSGVVHKKKRLLCVRNLIYRRVFDGRWITKCLQSI